MNEAVAETGLPAGAIRTALFSLTRQDVIRATADFERNAARRKRFVAWGIILLLLVVLACVIAVPIVIVQVFMPEYSDWVLGDFWVVVEQQKWALWPLAVLAVLSVVGRPLLLRYGVWRSFRENSAQYRDLQFAFSSAGIDVTWPNAALHNDWPFYSGAIESKEFFLLVYGSLYVAVPKRALVPSDVSLLAKMLRERLPKYTLTGSTDRPKAV